MQDPLSIARDEAAHSVATVDSVGVAFTVAAWRSLNLFRRACAISLVSSVELWGTVFCMSTMSGPLAISNGEAHRWIRWPEPISILD